MGKKTAPEAEALIKHVSKEKLSHQKIVDKLKLSGYDVSKSLVCKVVNTIGQKRQATSAGLPSPVKAQPKVKATRAIVGKIDKHTNKKNPQVKATSQNYPMLVSSVLDISY